MRRLKGFTLIEMLVVIGIIGILIAALVPVVKGVQVRAKEAAIKTNCANIETGLANYAQNHGGNYPGVAIDLMAPFSDHALGDPAFFTGGGVDNPAGSVFMGIIGAQGHRNNNAASVFEQMKTIKDTALPGGASNRERWFDSLILSDALQEYPLNQFGASITSAGASSRARMKNIFYFRCDIGGGFDPSSSTNGWGSGLYNCALWVNKGGDGVGVTVTNDTFDTTEVHIRHLPLGVPLGNFSPDGFSQTCKFGTDEGDYFAAGDFAYVPVLSSSATEFGDSTMSLEDERYKWGTAVTGYMLFGYGAKTHKTREFEDEQREFVSTGLPGCGGVGVDTVYENYILQCFEGAIYFSKHT
jgi:prepilin-type N-terminal cleavage/methylation domain-containing protein